jgi:hypothetical protein
MRSRHTELLVRSGSHWRHGLTAATPHGESKSFSTLCEVVGGTVDFCKTLALAVSSVRRWGEGSGKIPRSHVTNWTARLCGCVQDVPSNWAAKARASSRFTVELAPVEVLLGVSTGCGGARKSIPDRDGG